MISQPIRIIVFLIFLLFSLLGMLFLTAIIHEGIHVIQSPNTSEAVCISFNSWINDSLQQDYLVFYTEHNVSRFENVEAYEEFRRYTEKWATFVETRMLLLLGFCAGFFVYSLFEVYIFKKEENKRIKKRLKD